MIARIHYENREDWLSGRSSQGIGGSEAAAIVGMSPWLTAVELWRQKVGLSQPKDLSGNEAVERGIRMEPAIREFFKALHPECTVSHFPYDLLFQKERPWLFASLDGEIVREDGKRGVLEIKTGTTQKWKEWADGGVPRNYLVQCNHQLLATGWDFVFVIALLYRPNGDMELVEREVWREDHETDLDWLLQNETKFWRHIESGTMPPQTIAI